MARGELVDVLGSGAQGKAKLLDFEIHQMIASLLAVATHVDSTAAAASQRSTPQKQPKKAMKAMSSMKADKQKKRKKTKK